MKKIFYGFLAFAVATVIVTACSKDKDDAPAVVPVVDITNVISGKAFDTANAPVVGAKVVCELGSTKFEATTTASGYKFDKLTASGLYKLTFSKSGLTTTSVSVKVVSTAKAGAFIVQNVVMSKEGKKETATTNNQGVTSAPTTITILAADYPIVSNTTVVVAEQTTCTDANNKPVVNPQITITPINDVVAPAATQAAMPIAVVECKPEGIKFSAPVIIGFANPTGAYTIAGMKLYLLKNGNWVEEQAPVESDIKTGGYRAEVLHFSSYKIGVNGAVSAPVASTTPFSIASINNFDGKNPIAVQTVDVTNESGYIFEIAPAAAVAAAGITGADAQKIVDLITISVTNRNGGFAAGTDFTKTAGKYPMAMTVNPGVRVDFTAAHEYMAETLTFKFTKDNQEKTVLVKTKKATGLSVAYNAYNRNHTGGSGN